MSIDWRIDFHPSVSSTQKILKEKALSGEQEGYAVHALEQTQGYGRHGRVWSSETGNLYLSILLQPNCTAQKAAQLSFVIAIAVHETLYSYLMSSYEKPILKWPNDVLFAGKKCAGILLESDLAQAGHVNWLAVGIGINIKHSPSDVGVAMHSYMQEGLDIDVEGFRDSLLKNIERYYDLWRERGFEGISQDWQDRAHPVGAHASVKIDTHILSGFFAGIDDMGNMKLKDEQGNLRTISAGDVHFPSKGKT